MMCIYRISPAVAEFINTHGVGFLGIVTLYLCSHVLRMLRLVLLTFDKRNNAFTVVCAHALTALPSSLLPFKFGEILRLAAFLRAFDTRQKAFAVWLAERFGDILVISIFIFGFYLFDIKIPSSMQATFLIFILISAIGLLGLFSIAKIFGYLNRHLVLTSLSQRGLFLLRASHILRSLEINILHSIEGRISGFLLLSVLIWFFEIVALSTFISLLVIGKYNFAELFAYAILASLPSINQGTFGIYQSLALVIITVLFLLEVWLTGRLKSMKM